MLLVKATLELADASKHPGFITSTPNPDDIGNQQPYIFVGDQCFGFWGGIFGVSIEERQSLYSALGRKLDQIFPLRFSVDPSLSYRGTSGQVNGFYRSVGDPTQIEV